MTPDGQLTMALMRACSTWPCGIWIDGEKRTAPDGTSFAWQHWSHTFEYALAAGPGDWRTAGFPAAGQDYNHELLTVATDAACRSAACQYPAGRGGAGQPLCCRHSSRAAIRSRLAASPLLLTE